MTDQRQQDIREAGIRSRTAMAWLRDHKLPADPICYTVAYEYLFSDDPRIKKNVDTVKLEQDNFHQSIETIYQENIISRHYADLSMHGKNVSHYVAEILSLLLNSTGELGNSNDIANQVQSNLQETALELLDNAFLLHSEEEDYVVHKEEASKDELTKIFDKDGLYKILAAAIADPANHPIAIIRADIDHFKNFNDTNGKMMGDAILKHLAKSFESHLKGTDIVARYQEDEFVVVLPETPSAFAVKVAEALRKKIFALALKKKGSLSPVKVTISLGVSEFNGAGTLEETMDKAKKALNRSKDLGRNCVNVEL